ncbi:MAG: DUF11 domain-containing protein [Acidobacteria bacterium]|nr:DUF11 domain-containing protein [Acidobacteriota bacterium]
MTGTNVVYTIKVQNYGPSTAMDTKLVDALPLGQTLVSAEVLYPTALPGMPPVYEPHGTVLR